MPKLLDNSYASRKMQREATLSVLDMVQKLQRIESDFDSEVKELLQRKNEN